MKEIVKFLFELNLLKGMQRTGWFFIGEHRDDSVASHSFLTAVIAYYLAKKLKANKEKAMLMALLHDIPETRVGDINKVMARYVNSDEERAINESIPNDLDELKDLLKEVEERKTLEAKIVKDADLIEVILQAKVYVMRGNPLALEWANNARSRLTFEISKEIADKIMEEKEVWWKGLKKLD